jgi:hypothetical protein
MPGSMTADARVPHGRLVLGEARPSISSSVLRSNSSLPDDQPVLNTIAEITAVSVARGPWTRANTCLLG